MSDPRTDPPSQLSAAYDRASRSVGMLPTLRLRDNIIQAIVVLFGTFLGAAIGYFLSNHDPRAMALGAAIGLIASGLLTGFALIILGWRRARARR